jgi:aldehyde dehydrogenase (NAD+)
MIGPDQKPTEEIETPPEALASGAKREPAKEGIDRTYRFLIGGALVRPDQAASYSIKSSGGEVLGVVGDANRKDVRNAVEAARTAFGSWQYSAAHLRAQILYFFGENLAVEREHFAEGIADQTGRSRETGLLEVDRSVQRIFSAAAYADKFGGTVQPVLGRRLVVGLREPLGVIGLRAADEWPLLGLITPVVFALAMGNTIAAIAGKHAVSALDLVRVMQHSDIPAGVVNMLTAIDPDAVAQTLATHDDVDAIWLFGGAEGSKRAEEGSTSNMKQTWVAGGRPIDWANLPSAKLLQKSTQVKNIWVPYGA